MRYLHHYTTVESLKCILKNKTIRFSNLSKVNDTNEGETYDFGNIGEYIFVSCWTFNEEKIPMWNLYGDNFKGVRLSIPYPVFCEYFDPRFDEYPTLFELENSFFENYFILPTENNKFIVPINYTKDMSQLNPVTSLNICNLTSFNYGKIGICKSIDWEYEKECRFIIYTLPSEGKITFDKDLSENIGLGIDLIEKKFDIGLKYIDLKINYELFNQMEVVIGPKADEINQNKLFEYKKLYNPNLKIKKSKLAGIIR